MHILEVDRDSTVNSSSGSPIGWVSKRIAGYKCERCGGYWKRKPVSVCPNPILCEGEQDCKGIVVVYFHEVPMCSDCFNDKRD